MARLCGMRGSSRYRGPAGNPAAFQPPFKTAKNPPTARRYPSLTSPYTPPTPRKRENFRRPAARPLGPPPPPPLASGHAPGPRASAPGPARDRGTPLMMTAAHSGGRRRCLCFRPPHDTTFRSVRQGVCFQPERLRGLTRPAFWKPPTTSPKESNAAASGFRSSADCRIRTSAAPGNPTGACPQRPPPPNPKSRQPRRASGPACPISLLPR